MLDEEEDDDDTSDKPAGEAPDGAAAGEAMEYLATYLQRLTGPELRRAKEDFATLASFAKSEKWPKQQVRFLQDFLAENGVGES